MILVIDNYDSFTYNLVQCIGELDLQVKVVRNNNITINEIKDISPSSIIISPGPGSPDKSGISLEVIRIFSQTIPILGVCLGHQSIAKIFGAQIMKSPIPIHGKTSLIYHDNKGLFSDIINPFIATRYHSLTICPNGIPDNLVITAWSDRGVIMACKHKKYPFLQGIQFHPESLWTMEGKKILLNFLRMNLKVINSTSNQKYLLQN
jgi:anthranilate synthase component II